MCSSVTWSYDKSLTENKALRAKTLKEREKVIRAKQLTLYLLFISVRTASFEASIKEFSGCHGNSIFHQGILFCLFSD